jgi:hypothetical protein
MTPDDCPRSFLSDGLCNTAVSTQLIASFYILRISRCSENAEIACGRITEDSREVNFYYQRLALQNKSLRMIVKKLGALQFILFPYLSTIISS